MQMNLSANRPANSPQFFSTSSLTQKTGSNSLYLVDFKELLHRYNSIPAIWPLTTHYPLQAIISDLLRMSPYAGKEDPIECFFFNLEERLDSHLNEPCYDPMLYLWSDGQVSAMDLQIFLEQKLQDIDFLLHSKLPPWVDYAEFAVIQWFGSTAVLGRIFDEEQGFLNPGRVGWRQESWLTQRPWRQRCS